MRLELGAAAVAAALIACKSPADKGEEIRRRDEFARALALDASSRDLRLATTNDVHYEWGFTDVIEMPDAWHPTPLRWIGQRAFIRLRSHGAKPMRFTVRGWIDHKPIQTLPFIDAYVDGKLCASGSTDSDGGLFSLECNVDTKMLAEHEWVGLTLELSSIGWHWVDVWDLRIALISEIEWKEVTAP